MTHSDDSVDESNAKPKRVRRGIILLALVITAGLMWNVFSRIENWSRDLTTNHAKLDAESSDPALRPLKLPDAPADVAARLEAWASEAAGWSFESRSDEGSVISVHLTHTTSLMRFTDDVHVRLESHDAGTLVNAESQSRLGKGDLGQNPRNLRELVSGLQQGR